MSEQASRPNLKNKFHNKKVGINQDLFFQSIEGLGGDKQDFQKWAEDFCGANFGLQNISRIWSSKVRLINATLVTFSAYKYHLENR